MLLCLLNPQLLYGITLQKGKILVDKTENVSNQNKLVALSNRIGYFIPNTNAYNSIALQTKQGPIAFKNIIKWHFLRLIELFC